MKSDTPRKLWTLLGLAAGVAAGLWLWRRAEDRAVMEAKWSGDGDAVERIRLALARDDELAEQGLEVAPIADGVVELAGAVDAGAQRDRAVAIAHNDPGVHTVVNRVVVDPGRPRDRQTRVVPAPETDPMGETAASSGDEERSSVEAEEPPAP